MNTVNRRLSNNQQTIDPPPPPSPHTGCQSTGEIGPGATSTTEFPVCRAHLYLYDYQNLLTSVGMRILPHAGMV